MPSYVPSSAPQQHLFVGARVKVVQAGSIFYNQSGVIDIAFSSGQFSVRLDSGPIISFSPSTLQLLNVGSQQESAQANNASQTQVGSSLTKQKVFMISGKRFSKFVFRIIYN